MERMLILDRGGQGILRVPWPFRRLKAVGACTGGFIRSFCVLLLNRIWIFISLGLLPSLSTNIHSLIK